MNPFLTIVIPAYNAAVTIGRVLDALLPQLGPKDEVLVINDGSTDGTVAAVSIYDDRASRLGIRSFAQRQGAAAARNLGLRGAQNDLILFLGADSIPEANLLRRHRAMHLQFPEETVGCLGFVTWHPALPPTPFMTWLEQGPQNAFRALAGEREVDPCWHTYGSNLSVKRSLLRRVEGFDTQQFSAYGWEDIDLGRRLSKAGFRLFYEPTARTLHAHSYTIHSWSRRQQQAGRAWVTLAARYSDVRLPKSARGWRYLFRTFLFRSFLGSMLRSLARRAEHRWIIPRLYGWVTGWEFTKGVQEGLRLQS